MQNDQTPVNVDNSSILKEEEGFNVKRFIGKVFEYWYLFVISILLFGALSILYIRYGSPLYQINSKITVDDDTNNPTDKLSGASTSIDFSDMFDLPNNAYNEIDNLTSRYLMTKTVDTLHLNIKTYQKGILKRVELYDEAPFDVIMKPKTDSILKQSYNVDVKNGSVHVTNSSADLDTTVRFNS